MVSEERRRGNLYAQRLQKELAIAEEATRARMRWDMPILAENSKCSISLDLPIMNCKPTRACSQVCYACQGRQSYRNAIVKSLAVNRMIGDDPERAARKMVDEASGRTIRLAGSGELLPEHAAVARYIEQYGGSWWGFTRRVDTHRAMPRLMFSIDATTPTSVAQYVDEEVPVDRRAYLRRPGDPSASLEVVVTFPTHGPRTRYIERVPEQKTDCPDIRGYVKGCWECRRCY